MLALELSSNAVRLPAPSLAACRRFGSPKAGSTSLVPYPDALEDPPVVELDKGPISTRSVVQVYVRDSACDCCAELPG